MIGFTPLQSVSSGLQCYQSGSMWVCLVQDLAGAFGGELNFGLVVGGLVLLAYYIAGDGEIATPAVLTILLSGLLIPALPGGVRNVATGLMLIGIVGGAWAVARRYTLQVGT